VDKEMLHETVIIVFRPSPLAPSPKSWKGGKRATGLFFGRKRPKNNP
jgi:hypothetical protein